MAGLLLADKTAGLEDKLREAQVEAVALRAKLDDAQAQPAPAPQRI